MEVNTDILRIGGRYYAIKRIESKDIDINEELKELYEARHKQHVETLNNGVVQTAIQDWNTQINHIRSFEGKGQHAITAKHFDKPVMVYHGRFLLLRAIIYAPCEMQTNWDYIRTRQASAASIPAVREFLKVTEHGTYDHDSVIITFKPPFMIPLFIGFDEKVGTLYTPFMRTFHTMSGGNVCTGNHEGKDFWKLSDEALQHEMNRINMFSPATGIIVVHNTTYDIRTLIDANTFVSIRKRGEETWNV